MTLLIDKLTLHYFIKCHQEIAVTHFSSSLMYRAAPNNTCFSFILCLKSPGKVAYQGQETSLSRLVAVDLTLMKPNMFC